MISDDKLKEFFIDDKVPNWEQYCSYYNRILMGGLNEDFRIRDSLKDVLKHVDFYYCLKGFLTIGRGYSLIDSGADFPLITFNRINKQELRFVRAKDAEEVGEIIGQYRYLIKENYRGFK